MGAAAVGEPHGGRPPGAGAPWVGPVTWGRSPGAGVPGAGVPGAEPLRPADPPQGEREGVRWAWTDLAGPGRALFAVGEPGAVIALLAAAAG